MGVPSDFEKGVVPTIPYYRSTFVFVSRAGRNLNISSLNDPALRKLRVGVQLVGGSNMTPVAQALARRGIVDNVVGFMVTGDYREPNPAARIVDAVAIGDVDVALVWGPLAGYFAKNSKTKLQIVPVAESSDTPGIPLAFDICIGVKRSEGDLRKRIDEVIKRCQPQIDAILDEYNVPRVAAH
jgi:mxaJ protein